MKKSLLLLLMGLFAVLSAKTGTKDTEVFIKVTENAASVQQGQIRLIKFQKKYATDALYQLELWKGGVTSEVTVGGSPFGTRTELTGGELICNIPSVSSNGSLFVKTDSTSWIVPAFRPGTMEEIVGSGFRIKVRKEGAEFGYDFSTESFEITAAGILFIAPTNPISNLPAGSAVFYRGKNDTIRFNSNLNEAVKVMLYQAKMKSGKPVYVNGNYVKDSSGVGIGRKPIRASAISGATTYNYTLGTTYTSPVDASYSNLATIETFTKIADGTYNSKFAWNVPHFADATPNLNYADGYYVLEVKSLRDSTKIFAIQGIQIKNPIMDIKKPSTNNDLVQNRIYPITWTDSFKENVTIQAFSRVTGQNHVKPVKRFVTAITPAHTPAAVGNTTNARDSVLWTVIKNATTELPIGEYKIQVASVRDSLLHQDSIYVDVAYGKISLINPNNGGAFIRGTNMQVEWTSTFADPAKFTAELLNLGGPEKVSLWKPTTGMAGATNWMTDPSGYSVIGYGTDSTDGKLTGTMPTDGVLIYDFNGTPDLDLENGLSYPTYRVIYQWAIPSNFTANNFKIQVKSQSHPEVSDISDVPFSIAPGTLSFKEPTSLCKLSLMTTNHDISWNSNVQRDSVIVTLLKNGADIDTNGVGTGTIYTIAKSIINDKSCQWEEINSLLKAGTDYKIKISSKAYPMSSITSSNFEINGTVLSEINDFMNTPGLTWGGMTNPNHFTLTRAGSPWIIDNSEYTPFLAPGYTTVLDSGTTLVLLSDVDVEGTLISNGTRIVRPGQETISTDAPGKIQLTNCYWTDKAIKCSDLCGCGGNFWESHYNKTAIKASELVRLHDVSSDSYFKNCLFTGSSTSAMYLDNSSPSIFNCTFTDNGSDDQDDEVQGGAIYIDSDINGLGSFPKIYNSIFWGNRVAPDAIETISDHDNSYNGLNGVSIYLRNISAKPYFKYNCIEGGYNGVGTEINAQWGTSWFKNIETDPKLVESTSDFDSTTFWLGSATSCKNVGVPAIVDATDATELPVKFSDLNMPRYDLWGNVRVQNTTSDIGCSESNFTGGPSGINNNQICDYSLSQNYPNPFNPETTIAYSIKDGFTGIVNLKIYNTKGEVMQTISKNISKAGHYSQVFNGSKFTSGVYFYSIEAGDFKQMKKMIMVK